MKNIHHKTYEGRYLRTCLVSTIDPVLYTASIFFLFH